MLFYFACKCVLKAVKAYYYPFPLSIYDKVATASSFDKGVFSSDIQDILHKCTILTSKAQSPTQTTGKLKKNERFYPFGFPESKQEYKDIGDFEKQACKIAKSYFLQNKDKLPAFTTIADVDNFTPFNKGFEVKTIDKNAIFDILKNSDFIE